jgi:DinB superfamily/Pentapeptide repeats (8 copies)
VDPDLEWPFDGTGTYRGAHFEFADFSGAVFREVKLTGARMRGVEAVDVDIDGYVSNLVVNGVDVVPLVEAELDRRHPVRVLFRSEEPAELRRAWAELLAGWDAAIEQARALPESRRHERVDGEWSFTETLRHLVFVVDSWFSRGVMGEQAPYHRFGLPPQFMSDTAEMGIDLAARPSFDEVVELWRGRSAMVSGYLASASRELLVDSCEQLDAPGWPPITNRDTPVRCIRVILDETWAHHGYAVRDLVTLEGSPEAGS